MKLDLKPECGTDPLSELRFSEPEVLRVIGEESRPKGTDKLTSRQIDQEIKAARADQSRRD